MINLPPHVAEEILGPTREQVLRTKSYFISNIVLLFEDIDNEEPEVVFGEPREMGSVARMGDVSINPAV